MTDAQPIDLASWLPLVERVAGIRASRSRGRYTSQDFLGEAWLGLVYAAEHWDGVRAFEPYARRCIDGYVLSEIERSAHEERPRSRLRRMGRLTGVEVDARSADGGEAVWSETLTRLCSKLKGRAAEMFRAHYGAEESYEAIGLRYRVGGQRVRQMLREARVELVRRRVAG